MVGCGVWWSAFQGFLTTLPTLIYLRHLFWTTVLFGSTFIRQRIYGVLQIEKKEMMGSDFSFRYVKGIHDAVA